MTTMSTTTSFFGVIVCDVKHIVTLYNLNAHIQSFILKHSHAFSVGDIQL